MCHGFSQFSDFLHHFVLAKLATSMRVNFSVTLESIGHQDENAKRNEPLHAWVNQLMLTAAKTGLTILDIFF